MSDKLQFDLTVRVDPNSKKGVDTFVKQVEKRFSEVKLQLDYQKADAQAKKIFYSARVRVNKRVAAEMKAIKEVTAAHVQSQIDKQKADKQAQAAMDKVRAAEAKRFEREQKEEAFRKNAAAKELAHLESVDKKIREQAAARKALSDADKQYQKGLAERIRARELEDSNRYGAGNRQSRDTAHENDLAITESLEKERAAIVAHNEKQQDIIDKYNEKEVGKQKANYKKRDTLSREFLHRAKITQIQYDQTDEAALAQHQARIHNIMQNGANKNLSILRQELEIENVLFAKRMQGRAQQKQKYSLFGTSFTNKTNQNFFMFQQAIEDFQYAGLRGASNNLAMMASTMGGAGGLIALGTVLGITVLPAIAKATGLVSEEFMDATKAIERVNSSFDRFMNFRKSMFEDSQSKATHGRGFGSMLGDISGGKQELGFMNEEIGLLRERKALIESFYRTAYGVERDTVFGANLNGEAELKQLQAIQDALKQRHGLTDSDIADMRKSASGWTDTANSDVIDPVKKRLATLEMEAKLQEKLIQKAKERIGIQHLLNRQQAVIDRHLDKQFEADRGVNDRSLQGRSSKGYSNLIDDIQFRRSMRLQEVQDKYGTRMNELLFERDSASSPQEKLRIMQQIKSLQEEYYNTISRINGQEQGQVDKLNEKRNLIAEMQFHTQEAISNTEKQIEQEKRLQDEIRKRIEALDKAKVAAQNSFMGDQFDMERAIGRKQSSEERDKFLKNSQSREESALMQNDFMFDSQIGRLDAMSSSGSGSPAYRRMLSERASALRQQKQARAEMLRRQFAQQQERGLAGIDERLQGREAAKQKQYEGMISGRADSLGQAGDLEGQKDALMELYGLQKQQAMQGKTAAEMQQTFKRAEETHQRILAVMDAQRKKEEEALVESQKKQKVEEDRLAWLQESMETLSRIDIFKFSNESLQQAIQNLSNMGVNLGGVGAPAAPPAPGGQAQASAAGAVYNVNVAGLPQRPSITAAEMARIAAQQAKAHAMNTGMA